jgi:multiple sugar transport system substrate-binding protein
MATHEWGSRDTNPTQCKGGHLQPYRQGRRLAGPAGARFGLGLWANRARLEAANVRIPRDPDGAWSAEEFSDLLERLAQNDPDGQVLDLKLNYTGEWFSYAFAPLLQSAGGDLVDRGHEGLASRTLDGPASVAAMTMVPAWSFAAIASTGPSCRRAASL